MSVITATHIETKPAKMSIPARIKLFHDDLTMMTELGQTQLHTSADHRKTYYDAIERTTCLLRDIACEVSHFEMMIQERKGRGQDIKKHETTLEKVKKTCVGVDHARKLLRALDETHEYRQSHLPSEVEDPWDSIDTSEDEDAIRQYIKEIHGF